MQRFTYGITEAVRSLKKAIAATLKVGKAPKLSMLFLSKACSLHPDTSTQTLAPVVIKVPFA